MYRRAQIDGLNIIWATPCRNVQCVCIKARVWFVYVTNSVYTCAVLYDTTSMCYIVRPFPGAGATDSDSSMAINSLKFAANPDRAWAVERVKQKVENVPPVSASSPKPPGHTRFVCISG